MEACEVCGFEWDREAASAAGRAAAGTAEVARLLRQAGAAAATRPSSDVWSMLEYACHVRDVIYSIRDRIVVGIAEDRPTPKGMYGPVRDQIGLYRDEAVETVATEVELAGGLFERLHAVLTPELLAREIFYGYPTPTFRTLAWTGAQLVHEVEHHLADIRAQV